MKRIVYFELLEQLFTFKTISDEKGNEYVVSSSYESDSVKNIEDKTAFEAVESHVHLLDNVKKQEFERLIPVAKTMAQTLAYSLSHRFPDKKFYVYASVTLNDSFILRFHQKWDGEEPYFDPVDFNTEREKMFLFET